MTTTNQIQKRENKKIRLEDLANQQVQKPFTSTTVSSVYSLKSRADVFTKNDKITTYPRSINKYRLIRPYEPRDIKEINKSIGSEIALYDYNLVQSTVIQPIVTRTSPPKKLGKFVKSTNAPSEFILHPLREADTVDSQYQQRCQGMRLYFNTLKNEVENTEFSEGVLDLSWSVWETLRNLFVAKDLCLEVPDACPGTRDNFMYTWSKNEHSLECEIFGTGEIEFFYRDRRNGKVWGEDTTLEQVFSIDILDKVSLFIK